MARTPSGSPRQRSMLDRLIACLWWLIFLGGVGAGAAAGVVLALWLAVSPMSGLLLIVACWLGGNIAGWKVATRAAATLARRIERGRKQIHAARAAAPAPRGFPRGHRQVKSIS